MSGKTYTLEEVAAHTGYPLERVREAVERGNLSLMQSSSMEDPRVTDVELERWWHGVKHAPHGKDPSDDQAGAPAGDEGY